MDEKKEISIEALRKKVCEECRSRCKCVEKDDSVINDCPIINNYRMTGKIYYPMDYWH